MTVSMKAAKRVTVRRFAKAAGVAAFLSTLGAPQGMADTTMPDNCAQNLGQCSLQVWTRNSFPHAGSRQSVTFSNGQTLTCTSNGANTPRSCTLTGGQQAGSQSGGGQQPDGQNGTQAYTLRQQCADLKQQLHDLASSQDIVQTSVGRVRDNLQKFMQMSPGVLDQEIKTIQSQRQNRSNWPVPNSSEYARQADYMEDQVLNFLMDLRANQALGPNIGATTAQMQARATQMVNNQQAWARDQQRIYDQEAKKVDDQIANLDCLNVPSVNQSVPGKP
jgi:hypothetical protein